MKKNLTVVFLIITINVQAGLVGDFSQTQNLPGYIDLNPEGIAHRGVLHTKEHDDGVIRETPSALLASYFHEEKINIAKIEKAILHLKTLQENARIAYCQEEQAEDGLSQSGCRSGFPRPKLAKKWKKKSVNVAYEYAQDLFKMAIQEAPKVTPENINTAESVPFLTAFFDAFEIFQGVVQESPQIASNSGLAKTLQMIKEAFRPVIITKDRKEAANLLRPGADGENIFYSPEELEKLKTKGVDISLLNPPDSGFWRNPKNGVRSFDTVNYDGEERPYLEKKLSPDELDGLLDAEAPIEVEYEVEAPKASGETPKINVKYGKATYKLKFLTDRHGLRTSTAIYDEAMKVLRGAEVNTETVVNNLAAALGFTVDGTYFKDTVKVFFPDEIYENDGFDAEYKKMYKILGERWDRYNNTVSALKVIKTDPKTGRKYVELRHVQLERKSDYDTDFNIGSFARAGLGKSLKREHRGFALFLAWVWDVDAKDYNDTLKLVPNKANGKKTYKVVMSNSDMGSTLGSNRPNLFNYRFVKNVHKDERGDPEFIRFNYLKIYTNDVLDAVSFDDAKWIARLMGQLTPVQIYRAFRGAGYSDIISKYYTGIMIKKRNELLDALNLLGTEFVGGHEFTGTIEGYEEFFHMGFLTDPQNRLWDRQKEPFTPYWGAGLGINEGEPQANFIKMLKLHLLTQAGNLMFNSLVSKSSFSNEGLKFQEIIMPKSKLANGCKNSCFFQGFNAGVGNLIPWRFVVNNPDLESKHPYLIIDMFRLGFFAGTQMQQAFNVGIPAELSFGLGANHYQVSEFIKVTPVNKLEDIFDNKSALITMPKLNFRTARDEIIDGLKENEYLIQSHYVGLKAKASFSPYSGLATPLLPSITFRGDVFTANRVTYMGHVKSKILVGWDKLKGAATRIGINLLDLLNIPVIETELKLLSNVQRTFEFDRSIQADREVLFKHTNHINPKGIPQKYSLAARKSTLLERGHTIGFFNLIKRTSTRRTIQVDYEDSVSDFMATNTNYVRQINKSKVSKRMGVSSSIYKIQASVNAKKEIFAKVKLDGDFTSLNRKKFKYLLKEYSPLLPDNFIQFDPSAVLENFGPLQLTIETIFPEKGLNQIFSLKINKKFLCHVFAKVHAYTWGDAVCARLASTGTSFLSGQTGGKLRFLRLWKRYSKVREAYWELYADRTEATPKLKKIVRLLTDNGDYDYRVMNLFIALTEKTNYFRKASMKSRLEAFPGQVGSIDQDVDAAGTFGPSPYMLADNPEEEFELFTDRIHSTIRTMFYNEQFQ